MNFYIGTLGQVIIVELFVLAIWLKLLFENIRDRTNTLLHRRLLLTSLGLVINAIAVVGIMSFRTYELILGHWPYVPMVAIFFVLLGAGNFLFIVAACLGRGTNLIKGFVIVTLLWTVYVVSQSVKSERVLLCEIFC